MAKKEATETFDFDNLTVEQKQQALDMAKEMLKKEFEEEQAQKAKAQELANRAVAEPADEEVEIILPKERRGEDNFIIVSLNFKPYKIEKGVLVKVPIGIAKIIECSENEMEYADKYRDMLEAKAISKAKENNVE